MAAGTQDHSLKGGGCHILTSVSHSKIGIPQWDRYAAVTARSTCIVSSIKSRVLAAIVRHPKDPLTHTRRTGVPAATVTTTVAVAYTANIGVTRRPRLAPQVESDHKDPSGYPKLPKARRLWESPHGSFLGRTMSISIRRESRVP